MSAFNYSEVAHNRDLFLTWIGLTLGLWNWNADINGNDFPDENLADLYPDDTDPDDDCGNVVVVDGQGNKYAPTCQFNDTADLDDDLDGLFDLYDVDDDNDGIWDYLEVDSDSDWDDDANTLPPGSFFTGFNCQDNDDDGTDSDPDGDGFFQSVWDQGVQGQGLLFPEFYDVDNDNDGILTVKTGTMTTMVHLTSTKSSSVSGVKNNPLGIMTTMVFSTGQTMIGTAMAGPTKLRTQVSTHSLLHGITTMTVSVTTSTKTMTQTACMMKMKSCSGHLASGAIRPTHGITTTLKTAKESLIQTIPTPVQTLSI